MIATEERTFCIDRYGVMPTDIELRFGSERRDLTVQLARQPHVVGVRDGHQVVGGHVDHGVERLVQTGTAQPGLTLRTNSAAFSGR